MKTQHPSADAGHRALQDLLPWYAAGSLREVEAARVQEHLRNCAACREDLAWQRKLLETEAPLPAGLDPERALARLMPRLDQAPAVPASPMSPLVRLPGLLLTWLRGHGGWQGWALAGQFAAICVLAVLALPRTEAPAYQALGSGQAVAPDVLVVFKPEARVQDVQRILQAEGAHIVGGPTVTGAYMLDVEAPRQARLLAALRADPSVELAESLAGSQP
jgi:anti-sigma factor RsiW